MASVRKIKGGSSKKLRRPGISLYVADYRDETGQRKQERHYLTTKEAKILEAELMLREESYKTKTIKSYVPLEEFASIYVKSKVLDGWAPGTRVLFEYVLKDWIKYQPFIRRKKIGDITRDHVKNFLLHRRVEDGIANSTINFYICALKAFFNWAVRENFLITNPIATISALPMGDPEVQNPPLELDDFRRVLLDMNAAGDDDSAEFLIFLGATGRRISELIPPRFTWKNWKGNTVELHPLKRGRTKVVIELNDTLRAILERRTKEKYPAPFPYNSRHHAYSRVIKRYFWKLGLKGYAFNSTRKMTGTEIEDVYTASALLGHRKIDTTVKHYRKPKLDRISTAVSQLTERLTDYSSLDPIEPLIELYKENPYAAGLAMMEVWWDLALPEWEKIHKVPRGTKKIFEWILRPIVCNGPEDLEKIKDQEIKEELGNDIYKLSEEWAQKTLYKLFKEKVDLARASKSKAKSKKVAKKLHKYTDNPPNPDEDDKSGIKGGSGSRDGSVVEKGGNRPRKVTTGDWGPNLLAHFPLYRVKQRFLK